MNTLLQTAHSLQGVTARMVPRILTHACRDPNSAAYGAFDRDWWHYRIRDFPSSILQQAGYTVWLAGQLVAYRGRSAELQGLAGAACRFWNARAVRRGAFEEYYPWEQGYAPLAFSTLAVMKLVSAGVVPAGDVRAGAAKAAGQLLQTFESQAANQQVAGLAALAWLRKSFPEQVPAEAFRAISARTLQLQTAEGWYWEYGGPDLAYLSVTLDCLWDLFDATGDDAYVASATRALAFMGHYTAIARGSIGMQNARNTDYILPYGLVRFIVDRPDARAAALRVFTQVFESIESPSHFVHAIDDRYLCHYAGHSFMRACLLLAAAGERLAGLPEPVVGSEDAGERVLELCGHYLRNVPAEQGCSVIVSLRKGGVFSAIRGQRRASDFGWVAVAGGRQYISHWWSDQWTWTRNGNSFTVRGRLVPHQEILSTPAKHAALRLTSLLLGRRLIPALKRKLIFKQAESPYTFERSIVVETERVVVTDRIGALPEDAEVRPAPRSSKRHVSSADSFHDEDLSACEGVTCRRTTKRTEGVFSAETVYDFG